MDINGNQYKCEHTECPYKDCNYHIYSTGKYSYSAEEDIPCYLPKSVSDAKYCNNNMDI